MVSSCVVSHFKRWGILIFTAMRDSNPIQQHVMQDVIFCFMGSTVRKHACRVFCSVGMILLRIHNSLIAAVSVVSSLCTVNFL
jgi:hypothetical protein